jgi:rhamnulokinase
MAACRAYGQSPPNGQGELIRSILVSLACKYRLVLDRLARVTQREFELVHVVGGGTHNALLCQLTADLLGLPVVAGAAEATALGNVLVQAQATGEVSGLKQMREVAAASSASTLYEPHDPKASAETYERFLAVTGLGASEREHVPA